MAGNILNYYVSGNTAKGFHSFLNNNLVNLKKIYVLKGGLNSVKSNLMKTLGTIWVDNNFDIEYLHNPSNNKLVEGVINTKLNIGLFSESKRHKFNPEGINAKIEYIDFNEGLNIDKVKDSYEEIKSIERLINILYSSAYERFESALKIHDEWEEIYISNMDRERADSYSEEVIQMILKDHSFDKQATVKDRFFGGATPLGPVDHVENITQNISKRYFIKGRPGTGKSTLLKRLVKKAAQRGLDVDVYHCGFDPNSLDMVLLKEIDLVIFDSTAPHVYYPSRDNDEIIDMYKEIIKSGTDELYEKQLDEIISRYKKDVHKGINFLRDLKVMNDNLEKIYAEAINSSKLASVINKLMLSISNDTQKG